jgi:hypothetical protein
VTTPIADVSDWPTYGEEHVGSKPKVWLLDPRDQRGSRWLFKQPRRGTGEHWAEFAAAGIANALDIPHAEVRLANRRDTLGSISRNFLGDASFRPELVLGNTLLATRIVGYDHRAPKPPLHTVDAVLELLAHRDIARTPAEHAPSGVATANAWFVGYLLLDALVGNTDRHHENWGLIVRRWEDQVAGGQAFFSGANVAHAFHKVSWALAPTFDHASSLGRDIDDATRERRLRGNDPRFTVEHYAARGRSPLFGLGETARQLTTREAFARARELLPEAASAWLVRLAEVSEESLRSAVDAIPKSIASDTARAFANAVVASNRRFLLSLRR